MWWFVGLDLLHVVCLRGLGVNRCGLDGVPRGFVAATPAVPCSIIITLRFRLTFDTVTVIMTLQSIPPP